MTGIQKNVMREMLEIVPPKALPYRCGMVELRRLECGDKEIPLM